MSVTSKQFELDKNELGLFSYDNYVVPSGVPALIQDGNNNVILNNISDNPNTDNFYGDGRHGDLIVRNNTNMYQHAFYFEVYENHPVFGHVLKNVYWNNTMPFEAGEYVIQKKHVLNPEQVDNGDWGSALISGLSVVPGGDLLKLGKVSKHMKTIEKAIDACKATDKAKDAKKATGSYTVTFESGKKYHGKGPESRMNKSATDKAKTKNDPVKSKDFTPAKNDREAFKQESRRMDTDRVGNTPGHKNPNNYNRRASPGDKYRKQDKN
jgi:hypothetical protein